MTAALLHEAAQVQWACEAIAAFTVATQADLDALGVGLKEANARIKFLEGERTSRTAGPLAEVEAIRGEYRDVEAAYKALKAAIGARTVRYHQEQRATEDAARATALAVQEQARQAAAVGNLPVAQSLQTHAFQAMQRAPAALATVGVYTRKEWRVRVLDAALVPRALCVPDEALILADVRANLPPVNDCRGVVPEVARQAWAASGVEIYLHETAVGR